MIKGIPSDGRVLSLDLATELGWCLGRPQEEPHWGFHRLSPAVEWRFADWLRDMLDHWKPALVTKEQAPSIRWGGGKTNAKTLEFLIGLGRRASEVCERRGVPCYDVATTDWRRALTGKGHCKKGKGYLVIEALAQRGIDTANHNAADALGVWLYSIALVDPRAAARFDPLARKLAARGACMSDGKWCATHQRHPSECKRIHA